MQQVEQVELDDNRAVPPREAADLLGITVADLDDLVANGVLPQLRIANRITRYSVVRLKEYQANRAAWDQGRPHPTTPLTSPPPPAIRWRVKAGRSRGELTVQCGVIRGFPVGSSPISCPEHRYRDLLGERVGGMVEVSMPFGRADVATSSDIFEVEPYKRWRDGIRQAFAYGAMTGLTPNLAVYGLPLAGEVAAAVRLDLYLRIRDDASTVGLWFYGETQGWYKVGSREAAMRIPR